jgi:hypothetical protein
MAETASFLPANAVTVIRGTNKTLALTVKDSAGEVIDLTGSTIYMTVRLKETDEGCLFQKISSDPAQIEIPNPTDGTAKIYISPSDTAGKKPTRYVYDILIILSSAERHVVVGPAVFEIKAGVTVVPI